MKLEGSQGQELVSRSKTLGGPSILSKGVPQFPLVVISLLPVRGIARAGYSKADVKQYLFEHARIAARSFDYVATCNNLLQHVKLSRKDCCPFSHAIQ
jgi:hypothetical protein